MSRERIGALALRAYPPAIRQTRGLEMLSALLDAGGTSNAAFAWECGSLVVGGVRERAAITAGRLRERRGRLVAAVMVIVILTVAIVDSVNPMSGAGSDKGNMRALAGALAPRLRVGDLVFVAQPQQTKLADYYLPDGLRYATPFGLDDHPGSSSQFVYARLAESNPRVVFDRLLTTLSPGQQLLYIRPLIDGKEWLANRRYRLVRRLAAQFSVLLASDPELQVIASAPHHCERSRCDDRAVLYAKS